MGTSNTSSEPQESVRCLIQDKVAYLSFKSSKANSLSSQLINNLLSEFAKIAKNQSITVIVLRSEGENAFCAGASFEEFKKLSDISQATNYFLGFAKIISAIKKAEQLVILRVQGKAVGGALGLIAAADYVVASDTADLRLSELELGIGPFVVEPAIKEKIGLAAVSEMTIDTDWKNATWAQEKGLYQKICSSDKDLDEEISKLVYKLANFDAAAVKEIKKMFSVNVDELILLMEERAKISARLLIKNR